MGRRIKGLRGSARPWELVAAAAKPDGMNKVGGNGGTERMSRSLLIVVGGLLKPRARSSAGLQLEAPWEVVIATC